MKNCSYCKGNGYTYDGIQYESKSRFGLALVNKKETCKKCHGKGRK